MPSANIPSTLPAHVVQRLRASKTLPTMPGVAMQLVELCRSDDTTITQVARTLQQDPALVAKVLRYANSAAFGVSTRVSTVQRAATLLGMLTLQTIALSFSLVTELQKSMFKGFDHKRYWRRTLFSGAAGHAVAAHLGTHSPDEVFILSLLQDMGVLVLAHGWGDEYVQVVQRAGPFHEDLVAAERQKLGFDHAMVGAWIAREWNLPEVFVASAESSHDPPLLRPLNATKQQLDRQQLLRMIAVASYIGDIWTADDVARATSRAQIMARRTLALDNAAFEQILDRTSSRAAAGAELVQIDAGPAESMAGILDHARERLAAISLKSSLERMALADSAHRDALTGLYNRAYLDRALGGVIGEEANFGQPVSLAFCDVDWFKQVNDTFGHAAGDVVLCAIARRLEEAVQAEDIVARWGGEEFVVLMPGTRLRDALALCEKLRQQIAAEEVRLPDGRAVRVTISMGVTFTATPKTANAAALLRFADTALYDAKKRGRNCVSSA